MTISPETIIAKLYVDTGVGFNSKQVLSYYTVLGNEKRVEFDLTQYNGINSLKFNPLNDYCVVHINNIIMVREDSTSYVFENTYSNAVHQEGKEYIFSTQDPHIYFNIFDEKIRKVIVELEYIAIGKEALGYLGKAHIRTLEETEFRKNRQIKKIHYQRQEIRLKDDTLRLIKREIHRLKAELDDKTFAYESLLDSRAWKIVEQMRAFKRELKSAFYYLRYHHSYKAIQTSGLFDRDFYLKKQIDLRHANVDLLFHYIRFGAREGRNPHPLFDSVYYLRQHPSLRASDTNPLMHYLEKGAGEGRDPHPLFDSAYYKKQAQELDASKINPLVHYLETGAREGRKPHPLFDAAYYTSQFSELPFSDINPLMHYLETGAGEGKDPHPLFDTDFYMRQYPNTAASQVNPLVHYLTVGCKEGKDPHPLFDSAFYLAKNPKGPPGAYSIAHYLLTGANERKDPHPLFDAAYYLSRYSDVAASGMNPLIHYIEFGAGEKRNPHPLFDTKYYLEQNRDAAESGKNPLVHYIQTGILKKRPPNPRIDRFRCKPTISLITPVYNVEEMYLHRALESVLSQIYPNWQLCLVDDGSTKAHIKPILKYYAERDQRIKVKFLKENKGISVASNAAASLATGEYIGFLDHDDVLTVDALFETTYFINRDEPDLLYSDERVIDADGIYLDTIFKPDFSPDLLYAHNYITHFLVTKRSLFHEIGGFSNAREGAQDYDLILRLTEKTKKITHIPKPLYDWRSIASSTSADPQVKLYADDAGQAALQDAMDRKKIDATVLKANQRFFYRVQRKITGSPRISIVIPFCDKSDYLKNCIIAILEKSSYQNFEILGINNNSQDDETSDVISELTERDGRIRFIDFQSPFNYSKLNNFAVSMAQGEHVVLMNNDITITNADWAECLLEHSQREEVGAVGAKLYYPDGSIQHAGIIIGIAGFAGHSHKHFPHRHPGYYNRLMCVQNVSAVSGALLMVKKRYYEEAGGLDEIHFSVALSDVDFCLRLREKGYLNIFTPYSEAIHFESASRGYEEDPERKIRFSKEIEYFQKKWRAVLEKGDPYYNPNLTLDREDFSQKNEIDQPLPGDEGV